MLNFINDHPIIAWLAFCAIAFIVALLAGIDTTADKNDTGEF